MTLGRYQHAVKMLELWAIRHHRSLNSSSADATIVTYLHELCEQSGSIVDARSTVYGFIMLRMESSLPERMLLGQSKAALRGWSSRFPVHSKAGVDLRIWDVIAFQCLQNNDPLVCAAILLQGDTYTRPSEILGITPKSIIRPHKSRSMYWGLVLSRQEDAVPTKTGDYDDCVLLDSPGRQDLGVVLKFLLHNHRGQSDTLSLFSPLTLHAYNTAIKDACAQLDLGKLKLTPHVLRHSGPSSDVYHKIRSIPEIQHRGRWATLTSVSRYKKPGRMLLLHQLVPDKIWKQAGSSRTRSLDYFRRHSS